MENKHKQPNNPGSPMGGGHGMVMAGARAKDFKGSFRRLLSYLSPARTKLIIIFILAALSTIFAVASPKI